MLAKTIKKLRAKKDFIKAITVCIFIKCVWYIMLNIKRTMNKSINIDTGSSIKHMFDPRFNFIYRADGEHQQIRGIIYDPQWMQFDGDTPYEVRMKRLGKLYAEIIDYRKKQ